MCDLKCYEGFSRFPNRNKARNINSERQISFPFFHDLTELKNYVKTFFCEVCLEAYVASILGVVWDLAGLKPWTTWCDLGVDPTLIGELALEVSWSPFQAQLSYGYVKSS